LESQQWGIIEDGSTSVNLEKRGFEVSLTDELGTAYECGSVWATPRCWVIFVKNGYPSAPKRLDLPIKLYNAFNGQVLEEHVLHPPAAALPPPLPVLVVATRPDPFVSVEITQMFGPPDPHALFVKVVPEHRFTKHVKVRVIRTTFFPGSGRWQTVYPVTGYGFASFLFTERIGDARSAEIEVEEGTDKSWFAPRRIIVPVLPASELQAKVWAANSRSVLPSPPAPSRRTPASEIAGRR